MRSCLNLLVMGLSLLINFQQVIIVVHFKLNQEIVTELFCINKSKPELQCHGNCHLKKTLQETPSTESGTVNKYPGIDIMPISVMVTERQDAFSDCRLKTFIYRHSEYREPFIEIVVPPPIVQIRI